MNAELTLNFPSPSVVNVTFDGTESGQQDFINPVTDKDRADIRWYIETYGTISLGEPDDQEADRIRARLTELGKELFSAVFDNRVAQRLFDRFQDGSTHRVLTINSQDASILALPWELLHDPAGVFLFREHPHISIRRTISGAEGGRPPFVVEPKERLHLLFVVSRPHDAGFIDPRTDPEAILDALEEYAPGRVTCEFLRPATLNALVDRLRDDTRPAIDILHFDGHGVFAEISEEDLNRHPDRYGKSIHSAIQRECQSRGETATDKPVGVGFLLFQKDDGSSHLIPATDLSDNLFQSKVGLVVLSACQSAAMDHEGDAMAGVAGRLTSTGISAILAMTHSVLVVTTRMLFGKFYESLARGRGIAAALDDARLYLANNPGKYDIIRDGQPTRLRLDDWFLPALFHSGTDAPLLTRQSPQTTNEVPQPSTNLRERHEAGFFGRRRELWDVECWFASSKIRRISITGFGGQGKTELALEAGRWLLRTGMFQRAVFVDYSQVHSADAVAVAVSTIGSVLEETLIDAEAVTQSLSDVPTLIILDNLEALQQHAPEALQELLDAAAVWSQAGRSRVLLTSRVPDFRHSDYRTANTFKHRRIELTGLGSKSAPDDAIDWFAALSKLPPEPNIARPNRDELIALFDRVAFHPLSIAVLAQQLKTRPAATLGARLETLLDDKATSVLAAEDTPPSLIASLQLSLDRLSEEERHAVRRLGVFQGGAFEDDLLAITELGETDQQRQDREELQTGLDAWDSGDPRDFLAMTGEEIPIDSEIPTERLAQIAQNFELHQELERLRSALARVPASVKDNLWLGLRNQLEAAALIEVEHIPGVDSPFIRFHPTLSPILWADLDPDEKAQLKLAHRQRYYMLAGYLYRDDRKNPHHARAIALRELPNLLSAVHQLLDTGDPDVEDPDAIDFVVSVHHFLNIIGRTQEAATLVRRIEKIGGHEGSPAWLVIQSHRSTQFEATGQFQAAAEVFVSVLEAFGDDASYDRAATLARLGHCYAKSGRPDLAEAEYRTGIAVTQALEQTAEVKWLHGFVQTNLADSLLAQDKVPEAKEQYEKGLAIKRELGGNLRGEGALLGQIGELALHQGNLAEAVERFRAALAIYRQLDKPASEASSQHQLGKAFETAEDWKQAEHHYREAARLNEQVGHLGRAAMSWSQLAIVNESAGKPDSAAMCYRKAIEGFRAIGDDTSAASPLCKLAALLRQQPDRLDEARQLAEQSLSIKQTLDPGVSEIWATYDILARIADQQKRPDQAVAYRRLARDAKRNLAGTKHDLKQVAPVIAAVVGAVAGYKEAAANVGLIIENLRQAGDKNFSRSIERILAGERDVDALCAVINPDAAMIIETILAAIDDPIVLAKLLPTEKPVE